MTRIPLIIRLLLFCGLAILATGYGQESLLVRPGFDALHYEFSLVMPDSGSFIRGSARISVGRTAPEQQFRLDLVEKRVTALRVNNRIGRFLQDTTGLTVTLPAPSSVPDTLLIDVEYEGTVADGLIIKGSGNRWMAFGDNWPNRARQWLPTVDHPGDKATVTWRINAPAERTVVANGAIVESTPLQGGRKLTVWEIHRPIPTYIMVIAVATLVSRKLPMTASGLSEFPGGIPQTVHSFPEDREYLPGPFEEAVGIVEFFSRRIGLFPYEKLDHLQSSTMFGGMENASAIFYYENGFKKRQINSGLIAHETAHQWFGDAVTPEDWPHVWLSEGFATYWAELWTQHDTGDEAFRASMSRLRDQIFLSRTTTQRPVLDTTETRLIALLNSNSYQKGAWVLHMLRSTVGDTAFFEGMRRYYDRYKHRSASSSDFQRAMEESSGKELGWFFDQWLRRPGFIRAEIRWDFREDDRAILLRVKQDTTALPYRFVLRLGIETPDGRSIARMVEIPGERETNLRIPWDSPRPSRIMFDPFTELLWRVTEH